LQAQAQLQDHTLSTDTRAKEHIMSEKLFIQDGEVKREFTSDEYAQWELDKAEDARLALEAKAKAEAKAALLVKLGITAEEAALLLG
jgi:hypothetical protein